MTKIPDSLIKLLAKETATYYRYAKDEEDAKYIINEMNEHGFQMTEISNVGLTTGFRMSFLPESAWIKEVGND